MSKYFEQNRQRKSFESAVRKISEDQEHLKDLIFTLCKQIMCIYFHKVGFFQPQFSKSTHSHLKQ